MRHLSVNGERIRQIEAMALQKSLANLSVNDTGKPALKSRMVAVIRNCSRYTARLQLLFNGGNFAVFEVEHTLV